MMITGFYAGLGALLLLALSARIVGLRRKHQVGIGGGGQEELERAIRVQANCVEYMPLALILLALAESQAANHLLLHVAGAVLIIGRLLHAAGLSQSKGRSSGRFYGTLMTWLTLLLLALVNITSPLWRGG